MTNGIVQGLGELTLKEQNRNRTSVVLMIIVTLVALIPRLLVLVHYGPRITIHSDDAGYFRSAVWLLKYGTFSYYTPLKPTVHMMPGITLLLAAVIGLFGKGTVGLYIGKLLFTLIGVTSVLGVYKVGERMWNPWVGAVTALGFALYVPNIEVDSLFLTEPLFAATFAWSVYYILKAADTHRLRDIVYASIFFMLAMYVRPNVLLWAVIALIYLLMKRYPSKQLLQHTGVALAIFVVCMLPWWIRNEVVFHHFIALTDDSSNPLLSGTLEGVGFPPPNSEVVIEHQILRQHPALHPQAMHEIPWFAAERHAAVYRMRLWFHQHPRDFFLSYLWLKPGILWLRAYFPIRMLGVVHATLQVIQPWIIWVSLIGHGLAMLFGRGRRKEWLMVWLTLLYFTALFSLFFAYERYNVPIIWLMMMGVPAGLWAFAEACVRTLSPRGAHGRRTQRNRA